MKRWSLDRWNRKEEEIKDDFVKDPEPCFISSTCSTGLNIEEEVRDVGGRVISFHCNRCCESSQVSLADDLHHLKQLLRSSSD